MNINNTLRETLVALIWTFSALIAGCSSNLQDEIKNMNLKELCNKDIKFKKAIENSKIIDKYKYYHENDDLKETFEVRFVIKGDRVKGVPQAISKDVEFAGNIKFAGYKASKVGYAEMTCSAYLISFIKDKKSIPFSVECGAIVSTLATDDMLSLEKIGINGANMIMMDR